MPLKIQSSPKCKARKKFCCAAYRVYVSKEFFSQRGSWDEIWIFRGILERVKGIEPSYAAWEAAVLPLNYTREVADFTWDAINIQITVLRQFPTVV
jgi:hypothetical protein